MRNIIANKVQYHICTYVKTFSDLHIAAAIQRKVDSEKNSALVSALMAFGEMEFTRWER